MKGLVGFYMLCGAESLIYSAEVNYDAANDTFYIQTMNSDGAGSYLVVWKVEKGVYKDRLVAYGF